MRCLGEEMNSRKAQVIIWLIHHNTPCIGQILAGAIMPQSPVSFVERGGSRSTDVIDIMARYIKFAFHEPPVWVYQTSTTKEIVDEDIRISL
jgi:hypothetical protein